MEDGLHFLSEKVQELRRELRTDRLTFLGPCRGGKHEEGNDAEYQEF
jgi:hypothetical protein